MTKAAHSTLPLAWIFLALEFIGFLMGLPFDFIRARRLTSPRARVLGLWGLLAAATAGLLLALTGLAGPYTIVIALSPVFPIGEFIAGGFRRREKGTAGSGGPPRKEGG